MDHSQKQRLLIALSCLVAVVLGTTIANESKYLPVLIALMASYLLFRRVSDMPVEVAAMGFLMIGFLVGNRGFAQQTLFFGLPLFPAELGLALGCSCLLLNSTINKELPCRRDSLNILLLLWIAYGTARLLLDLPRYKFMALRDFSTIYYSLFFFIAQHIARSPKHSTFIIRCALAGVVVLCPLNHLARLFPDFFANTLVFHRVPLLFFKNDLVQTFVAAGSILLFHQAEKSTIGRWIRFFAIVLGLSVLLDNCRAASVGLLAAALLLWIARRRSFGNLFAVGGFAATCLLFLSLWLGVIDWRSNLYHAAYERASSIFDTSGTQNYESESLSDKPDNNRFRMVWWENVIKETLHEAPLLGLGFGHNLATQFVRNYEMDLGDEFSARSPHNIMITIFGRMGALGLLLWLALLAAIARRCWDSLRHGTEAEAGAWGACCVIFVSSVFGVVLEGPMGAFIFWTLLGVTIGHASNQTELIADSDSSKKT